jgi:hypothetical protein
LFVSIVFSEIFRFCVNKKNREYKKGQFATCM